MAAVGALNFIADNALKIQVLLHTVALSEDCQVWLVIWKSPFLGRFKYPGMPFIPWELFVMHRMSCSEDPSKHVDVMYLDFQKSKEIQILPQDSRPKIF